MCPDNQTKKVAMSNLKRQLQESLKEAMKAKDKERRNAIRLLHSAIKQVEIDERMALDDEAVLGIIRREAKKRRETISELESAGRAKEAASERFELAVTEEFLPRQLTEGELRPIVEEAVRKTNATSISELGKVMAVVMPRVRGLADGRVINALARELLS